MIKILWIEDDADELEDMLYFLKKEGHIIKVAKDLKDAKSMVSEEDFDIAILDIKIPTGERDLAISKFAGKDFIEELHKSGGKFPPIMVYSVVNDADIILDLRDLGIQKILQKGNILPSKFKEEVEAFAKSVII